MELQQKRETSRIEKTTGSQVMLGGLSRKVQQENVGVGEHDGSIFKLCGAYQQGKHARGEQDRTQKVHAHAVMIMLKLGRCPWSSWGTPRT